MSGFSSVPPSPASSSPQDDGKKKQDKLPPKPQSTLSQTQLDGAKVASQDTLNTNAELASQPQFTPSLPRSQTTQTQSTQTETAAYEAEICDHDDDDDEEEEYGVDENERSSFRAIIEGDDAEILRRFGEEDCTQDQAQQAEVPKLSFPDTAADAPQPPAPSQQLQQPETSSAEAVAAAAVANVVPSFKVTPILQNIVATVNLGCPLDLKKITTAARNTEYNPQRFPALIMRIRDPKATALIFASGKVVCTGTKSEEMAKYAAKKFARIIQKIGFQVKFKNFKVQNIVASCDVKFPIRLEQLSQEVDRFSTYEPEIFPGLIFRMAEPKVSLLIFVSGKIVLSGAKTIADIRDAFNSIIPVLRKYQKTL